MNAHPAWRTAVHEAGHAVVSWHLGFLVNVVSIRPGEDTFGRMSDTPDFCIDVERDERCSERETHERAAVVCYAGLAAESVFGLGKYDWRDDAVHGGWEDDRIAREEHLALVHAADDIEAAVDRCRAMALTSTSQHQGDIRRLAEALLEFETLTDCEIEHVLGVPSVAASVGAEQMQRRRAAR